MIISMANTCNFYTFYVCPNSRCIYMQCSCPNIPNFCSKFGLNQICLKLTVDEIGVCNSVLSLKSKKRGIFLLMYLPTYLYETRKTTQTLINLQYVGSTRLCLIKLFTPSTLNRDIIFSQYLL